MLRDSRRTRAVLRIRRVVSLTLASSCLCAVVAPTAAQQTTHSDRIASQGSIRESITVREATMYVRVQRSHRPVEGLRADDFRVALNGQELEIVSFEELETPEPRSRRNDRAASSASEPVVSAVGGRNLLVIFDLLFLPRAYTQAALDAARRSLRKLGPADRVAVVMLGSRAILVNPFSDRPEVVEAALDFVEGSINASAADLRQAHARLEELAQRSPGGSSQGLEKTGLRAALALGSEVGRSLTGVPQETMFAVPFEGAKFDTGDDASNLDLDRSTAENQVALSVEAANRALSEVVRLFADVAGPRYAFLLSAGMPTFRDYLEDGIDRGNPRVGRSGAGTALLQSFQNLAYTLEGYGWAVQAFDVTGVGGRALGFPAVDAQLRPPLSPQEMAALPELALEGGLAGDGSDSLFFLAAETGGELFDNFNRLDIALDRALDRTSHHYRVVVLLPSDPDFFEKRRQRRLQVELVEPRKGVTVSSSMAAQWSLPAMLRHTDEVDTVRAELLDEREVATLPLQGARLGVFRQPLTGLDRLERAVVVLEASKVALAPSRGPAGAEATLLIHAIALPADESPGAGAQYLDLWAGSARWPLDGVSPTDLLLVVGDLVVPCDGARVRVRLGDPVRGKSWLFEQTLSPACETEPRSWVTPLHTEDSSLAVVVEEGFDLRDPEQNPFRLDGRSYLPQLRSSLISGEALRLFVRSYGVGAGSQGALPDVSVLELRSGERQWRTLEPEGETLEGLQGVARFASLRLDVRSGTYALSLLEEAANGSGPVVTVFASTP